MDEKGCPIYWLTFRMACFFDWIQLFVDVVPV